MWGSVYNILMNNVILILGMHRSGTSVLTRAVNLLGAALPKSILGKNSSNLRGHWESEVMIVAHDDLLSDSGSDWKDWRRLGWDKAGARKSALMSEVFSETFASEYDEGESVSVVKEPRICRFAASYISTLEKLSAQIHSVIVVRNPLEIANSLQQRDDMQKLDALYLWLTHMLEAELATRGRSRSFVSYESLLKAPDKICANLLSEMPFDLPYEIEEVRKQITEYVSPSLKRQSLAAEDVVLDPIARGWVSDCFEAFMVLAENPTSAAALRKLDDVRAAYFPVLRRLSLNKKKHGASGIIAIKKNGIFAILNTPIPSKLILGTMRPPGRGGRPSMKI